MTRDNKGLEDFKIFSETKTLVELEMQRYNAQEMFYRSVLDDEPKEMREKYLDAWKLASTTYHERKWAK